MKTQQVTLDYKAGVLSIGEVNYASAIKTTRGYRWSCINGRSSRRIDFPAVTDALTAACKALGIRDIDVIVYPDSKKIPTALDINVEIENPNHANMIALVDRIKFLITVAQNNNVRGEDNLLELLHEGLQDWNEDHANFYIYKGGHHVAVTDRLDGRNERYVLLSVGG